MVADLKYHAGAAVPTPAQRSLIWRMTFPGMRDQPGRVRRELANVLRVHPDLDDILMVASELCTNAVVHSRSGHQGGTFSVEITATGEESLTVAVSDEGAATGPCLLTPAPTDTHFRGLQVVKSLSRDFGVDGDAEGRKVWAVFAPLGRAVPCADEPC